MRTVSREEMVAQLAFRRQMLRRNCLKYIDKKYWEIAEAFYHELVGVEEFAEAIGLMVDNRAEREELREYILSCKYRTTKKEEAPCRENT